MILGSRFPTWHEQSVGEFATMASIPRALLLIVTLLTVIGLAGCAGTQVEEPPPGRFHIGYSFDPPSDWIIKSQFGMVLPLAFGPTNGGLQTNLTLAAEVYASPFERYIEDFLDTIEAQFPNSEPISSDPFTADSGLVGRRVRFFNEYSGFALRQTAYVFPGLPGQYAILMGTTGQVGGEAFDAIFDAAAKTFRVH